MSNSPWSTPPDINDVKSAAVRIAPYAVCTPLLESPHFNEIIGGRLLVKAEPLQRTGSFKFRGAFNTVSQLSAEEAAGGVVAYSSGNHAQGVAAAAQILGLPAVIVMPEDAPATKIANTKSYGAEVVLYDRNSGDREALGEEISRDRGASLIRPYDDSRIIAGQGTTGLEIAEQVTERNLDLDAVLVCCGGGGLISGCATALAHEMPQAEILAVEPEDFDDTARSLEAGERLDVVPGGQSFCDALLSPTPGELTFGINKRLLTGGLAVSDAQVAAAMRQAYNRLKLVVEPGGAVALAAALSGVFDCRGKTVAVVCSGGNVDAELFAQVLGGD
jgi:threonine dehydratase